MNTTATPVVAARPDQAEARTEIADLAGKSWLIVSQYRSDRVVYFTDDPDFDVPGNADWCYVSPYVGALPEGMTLRNCWSWRYRGMVFIDERKAPAPDPAQDAPERSASLDRATSRAASWAIGVPSTTPRRPRRDASRSP